MPAKALLPELAASGAAKGSDPRGQQALSIGALPWPDRVTRPAWTLAARAPIWLSVAPSIVALVNKLLLRLADRGKRSPVPLEFPMDSAILTRPGQLRLAVRVAIWLSAVAPGVHPQ